MKKIINKKNVFSDKNVAIKIEHLFCIYNENTENQFVSLCDNNIEFEKNKIHYIIGSSGCGKSTLINHFNGLLKSKYGNVNIQNNHPIGNDLFINKLFIGVVDINIGNIDNYFHIKKNYFNSSQFCLAFQHSLSKQLIKILFAGFYKLNITKIKKIKPKTKTEICFYLVDSFNEGYEVEITNKIKWENLEKYIDSNCLSNKQIFIKKYLAKKKIKEIRKLKKTVGIVFQFPEYQLFKETILKDVMFGPITLGIDKKTGEEESIKRLNELGINNTFLNRSPFDLSGGQKRRVAIAGILAFDPDILIFDEPTAGLDPKGEQEIMDIIEDAKDKGKTIIVISHNMDHVLERADNVVVMHDGEIIKTGEPYDIFMDNELLKITSIDKPQVIELIDNLVKINSEFETIYNQKPKNVDQLAQSIKKINKL